MAHEEETGSYPVLLTPSMRRLLGEGFSLRQLKEKLSKLKKEERKEIFKILEKYGLQTDKDFQDFLRRDLLSIKSLVKPKDRVLLSDSLINKLINISKISYAREIKDFVKNAESTTQDLDYLISSTLRKLWIEKYEKEEAFRLFKLHEEFEPILFKDPQYRNHFIHQFQVFLAGIPIIEEYYDEIYQSLSKLTDTNIQVDFSWLLAATFHDIGYPIQRFDFWSNAFFKDFLDVSNMGASIDFSKILLVRNFQEYLDKLTSFYSHINNLSDKRWLYTNSHMIDNRIRAFFTEELIERRNHGVISTLALMDRIEFGRYARRRGVKYKDTIFSSSVMPAVLAILLHHKSIYQNEIIKKIHFKKNSLAFLLIYCDTIQEWGRPTTPYFQNGYDPLLTKFLITEDEISATLTYYKILKIKGKSKTNFQLKVDEVKNMFRKIKSRNPIFEIQLTSEDSDHEEPTTSFSSK